MGGEDKSDGDAGHGGLDPVSATTLALALQGIERRLDDVDERLGKVAAAGGSKENPVLAAAKVILGGWPAFGILFLILFYGPIHEAINAIPGKVRQADEIGILGLTLKSAIRKQAERIGASTLSETIPKLSREAIAKLLIAPAMDESLVSYSKRTDDGRFSEVHFPSPGFLKPLAELQEKDLVTLKVTLDEVSSPASEEQVEEAIARFKRDHPGLESSWREDRATWRLDTPLDADRILRVSWALTGLGQKAVEVIVTAVAAELAGEG